MPPASEEVFAIRDATCDAWLLADVTTENRRY
jgi:hypothetical protein